MAMNNKFDRFTPEARQALALAREQAQALNQNSIGTEHLLLGILKTADENVRQIIKELGGEIDRLTRAVEFVSRRAERPMMNEASLTDRARLVIQYADDEARQLDASQIGTEHLFLGLIREKEGIAAGVLESFGITLDRARFQLRQHVRSKDPASFAAQQMQRQSLTPALNQVSHDLTAAALNGKLDPVIGREAEIERAIQILSRRAKNNPVLIGEAGVGKTAIAEGLAQRLVTGYVPESLLGKRLVSLDIGLLVAGTKFRGEFEERLKKVLDEIASAGDILIFIDEVHVLVGAGVAEGSIDAANLLKPALARGEFQIMGATTLEEYRKYIEKDAALERRFQPIQVRETTIDETILILRGLRSRYEDFHKVEISDEAIKMAVEMADRYITDRYLPDKALDLIDEAASRLCVQRSMVPQPLRALRDQMETIQQAKDQAIYEGEFKRAADLRLEENTLRKKIIQVETEWHQRRDREKSCVTGQEIAQVISMWTGIPAQKIAQEESVRLLQMEEALHRRVIGQQEAIETIARAVRRQRAEIKDPRRPTGSFLFVGPTGTGKTELARTLAEFLFGSEDAMIKIDMSEFMERHTAARLTGSPPGYVGYEEAGQLTEAVRRRPYSVVLLDELEKAHPSVYDLLLQVLEDGKLTDAKGHTVDFRNTILIMTSNVGSSLLQSLHTTGFIAARRDIADAARREYDVMKDKIQEELKQSFKPEFLNRIDATIVFHALTPAQVHEILDILLARMRSRLVEQELTLEVSPSAKVYLVEQGYDAKNGARPLRRVLQNLVEDNLAEGILEGRYKPGDQVQVDFEGGQLVFKVLQNAHTVVA